MIEAIVLGIFSYIKKNKNLAYDDQIYIYGLEILISTILDTIIVITLSLVFNNFIGTLVFLIVFSTLRLLTGGYHAKTYLGCSVVLVVIYLSYIGITVLITPYYSIVLLIFTSVLAFFIIVKYSPIDNPNKHLDSQEKKRFKGRSIIMLSILLILSLIIYFIFKPLSMFICISIFLVVILMVVEIMKRRTS